MTLFDKIKKIAHQRGFSIAEVERKAGISTNYLYQWKTRAPSPKSLKSVAKALDVSVDYLLGITDEEQPESKKQDMEVEEALNSMRSYQGQPISDEEREVMRGIIKGYLDNKNKK